uniref:Uncharacterized protein n=1 Tax=Arundo donax TaxID=35708 RepID=A0A0A9EAY9_ARUDO
MVCTLPLPPIWFEHKDCCLTIRIFIIFA